MSMKPEEVEVKRTVQEDGEVHLLAKLEFGHFAVCRPDEEAMVTEHLKRSIAARVNKTSAVDALLNKLAPALLGADEFRRFAWRNGYEFDGRIEIDNPKTQQMLVMFLAQKGVLARWGGEGFVDVMPL